MNTEPLICSGGPRGEAALSYWKGALAEVPSPQDVCALQVNPNSIAAKDGRIREGDRIIQVSSAGRSDPKPRRIGRPTACP